MRAGVKRTIRNTILRLSTLNSHTNLPVTMRCEQVHSLYVSLSSSGFGSTDVPQGEFKIAPFNCLL